MSPSIYIDNSNFLAWSQEHFVWLFYGFFSTLFWIYWGRKSPTEYRKRMIGATMAGFGVLVWLMTQWVMFYTNQVQLRFALPFHLCYFLNLVLPFMVWKRSFALFDLLYPIVMAGCLQALITPDLVHASPHYKSLRYWLVHIGLIQSMLYAIFVYGFRPTAKGILKCALFLNAYALCLAPLNLWLDTNFLYLREPAPGSIMELFGPWPWYLVGLEALMFVLFSVVYLPFAGRGKRVNLLVEPSTK